MVTIARDVSCPKCGYPETYQELSDDGSAGCRRCGWRIRLDVLAQLTPAQRVAYFDALEHGQAYEAIRGRLAQTTPGRRQYAHKTLHALWQLGLIEPRYGRWSLVDTAASQWQVRTTTTDELIRYLPTEEEAKHAVSGAVHLTYAAPTYVPTSPTPKEV